MSNSLCSCVTYMDGNEMEDPAYERYTYAFASFPYSLLWRQYNDNEQSYVSSSAHTSSLCSYVIRYLHRVMARSFVHAGATSTLLGINIFSISTIWLLASRCTSVTVSSTSYGSRYSCQSRGAISVSGPTSPIFSAACTCSH